MKVRTSLGTTRGIVIVPLVRPMTSRLSQVTKRTRNSGRCGRQLVPVNLKPLTDLLRSRDTEKARCDRFHISRDEVQCSGPSQPDTCPKVTRACAMRCHRPLPPI